MAVTIWRLKLLSIAGMLITIPYNFISNVQSKIFKKILHQVWLYRKLCLCSTRRITGFLLHQWSVHSIILLWFWKANGTSQYYFTLRLDMSCSSVHDSAKADTDNRKVHLMINKVEFDVQAEWHFYGTCERTVYRDRGVTRKREFQTMPIRTHDLPSLGPRKHTILPVHQRRSLEDFEVS